jgi:hypothetical protein
MKIPGTSVHIYAPVLPNKAIPQDHIDDPEQIVNYTPAQRQLATKKSVPRRTVLQMRLIGLEVTKNESRLQAWGRFSGLQNADGSFTEKVEAFAGARGNHIRGWPASWGQNCLGLATVPLLYNKSTWNLKFLQAALRPPNFFASPDSKIVTLEDCSAECTALDLRQLPNLEDLEIQMSPYLSAARPARQAGPSYNLSHCAGIESVKLSYFDHTPTLTADSAPAKLSYIAIVGCREPIEAAHLEAVVTGTALEYVDLRGSQVNSLPAALLARGGDCTIVMTEGKVHPGLLLKIGPVREAKIHEGAYGDQATKYGDQATKLPSGLLICIESVLNDSGKNQANADIEAEIARWRGKLPGGDKRPLTLCGNQEFGQFLLRLAQAEPHPSPQVVLRVNAVIDGIQRYPDAGKETFRMLGSHNQVMQNPAAIHRYSTLDEVENCDAYKELARPANEDAHGVVWAAPRT